MIRMGMVGCGRMAGSYLSQMEPLSDRLSFTGLVDMDLQRAQKAASSSPIASQARTATRLEDILDSVDALVLAVPHDLHRDMAIACLEAKKHVLIEKPLAITERQGLEIIEAAERSGCVAMHGYVMRYVPLVREFCRLIREQAYGPCFHMSIWTEQYTDLERGAWLGQVARVGGGQLFSHGCHYIDLLLHCLGDPVCGTHLSTNNGTPWMEMEGTSNVSLKFVDGATAYHFGTWGARGSKLQYSMHAHCTGGMLELDYRNGSIVLWRDPSRGDLAGMSREELGDPGNNPKCRILHHEEIMGKNTHSEMIHFLDCIASGALPETDLRSGMQSLRAIWRLYAAEQQGSVANLEGLSLNAFRPEPDPILARARTFGYTVSAKDLFGQDPPDRTSS